MPWVAGGDPFEILAVGAGTVGVAARARLRARWRRACGGVIGERAAMLRARGYTTGMIFGPVTRPLPGVERHRDMPGDSAGERPRSSPIARARGCGELDRALTERRAVATSSTRPGRASLAAAPPEVLASLELADAGILCIQPHEGERRRTPRHRRRRRAQADPLCAHGRCDASIMCEGMRADYHRVDRLSQQLCDRMPWARRLTVRTAAGTNFTATFDPSLAWVKTSGLINPRYWSNLPAGEAFTGSVSELVSFV
jgi:hypothetical protein